MYCGIIGQHPHIVEQSLSYIHAKDIIFHNKNIITFITKHPERLSSCAALIKWWKKIWSDFFEAEECPSRIGVAEKSIGSHLKKSYDAIKSFKIVELVHADKEIKELWSEIIQMKNDEFFIIQWYQDIELYEEIDFKKPVWGMNVGMMPSKLALTMINIWIGIYELSNWALKNQYTIWDPFCGFWTTNFLTYYLWCNTIWSDMNITNIKQNRKRWTQHQLNTQFKNKIDSPKSLFFKHDVTQIFTHPGVHHTDIIVSEWWLWHIVTHKTHITQVEEYASQVYDVYARFFEHIMMIQSTHQRPLTIVITIPVRLQHNLSISEKLQSYVSSLWQEMKLIDPPYSRPWQKVGRHVAILSLSTANNKKL